MTPTSHEVEPPVNPGRFSYVNQNMMELNQPRTNGFNGLFVESQFAAVLLDLTDNALDADGIPGDDDPLQMTGLQLATIMVNCRTHSPSTYKLSHTDQFIYCAENDVNAKYGAPSLAGWGTYNANMTYDGPTTLPNRTDFRNSWRYNLYNLP